MMGVKNRWTPQDRRFLVWVVFKYTELLDGFNARRAQDMLKLVNFFFFGKKREKHFIAYFASVCFSFFNLFEVSIWCKKKKISVCLCVCIHNHNVLQIY